MLNSFYLKDISGFEVSKANLSWYDAKQVFKIQIDIFKQNCLKTFLWKQIK